MRLWVNTGCASSALTLSANISDHCAAVSLKSLDLEPYQAMATRPGLPAMMVGKTLEFRPPLSTWWGALQVAPLSLDDIV